MCVSHNLYNMVQNVSIPWETIGFIEGAKPFIFNYQGKATAGILPYSKSHPIDIMKHHND